jgi:hypothetical protein
MPVRLKVPLHEAVGRGRVEKDGCAVIRSRVLRLTASQITKEETAMAEEVEAWTDLLDAFVGWRMGRGAFNLVVD